MTSLTNVVTHGHVVVSSPVGPEDTEDGVLDIGIDLDGVGYDFVHQFRMWRHLSVGVPLEAMPDAEVWHFHKEQWGMTTSQFLEEYAAGINAGFIFLEGDPMDGFLRGLEDLKAQGHRLHVVTNREIPGAEVAAAINTEAWLERWSVPYDTLTLTADKASVDTHLFIDDCADNYDALENGGRRPYLLDRPWNSFHPGRRVHSWDEFVAIAAASRPA